MSPKEDDYKAKSSLGFKYPTLRDHPLHTPDIWLEGKRADDNADGLWRINDSLYDFTKFINLHPGGVDWLELTKGTDITEAFEAHHISTRPEQLLGKYFIRKALKPRNSPFTLKENGFYRTLKRKVAKELERIPDQHAHRSKVVADLLLFGFLFSSLVATYQHNYWIGAIAAAFLSLLSISAHNFFHQRDNFRMYYFDLTMMSSRGWRVSHALSHHIYTNTIYDFEISSMEPLIQHLPHKKKFFARYVSWVYSPIFYSSIYIGYYIRLIIQAYRARKSLRKENYIPVLLFFFLYFMSNQQLILVLKMFFWIEGVSSLIFGIIGINGAHHHPSVFHDGDAARPREELDWGVHQLDAVMDRTEITGSHFWVLVTFGDHALHHLFPTIDHAKLYYLYPVFEETCKEFGVELRRTTSLKLACGQFQQLANVEPNRVPPKKCKLK